MVNKFICMYACSHGGSWEHVICCKCCEPCDLLLWIYELELDRVGHHPYQFHGNCIYTNTCWWIHIWYLLVKVQNMCRLRMHRITGTFFYKKNSEIEWIFFLNLLILLLLILLCSFWYCLDEGLSLKILSLLKIYVLFICPFVLWVASCMYLQLQPK